MVARATGRVLLLLRSPEVTEPGTWGLPGGRIDGDESPREAAARELREETEFGGHIEFSERPLFVYEEPGFRYSTFAGIVTDEFDPDLNWENVRAGWFSIDDLPQPLHFGVAEVFRGARPAIEAIVRAKKPRGYEWSKSYKLYHATVGARAIVDEGFKTRRQLGGINATGGGTDSAISLTMDLRVAQAIVLGLRVARGIARKEIQLGELIIQGAELAPKANALALKSEQLESPEFVVNIDRGLWPFSSGMGYGRGIRLKPAQLEEVLASGQAVDIDEVFSSPQATRPMRVDGWAPVELLNRYEDNAYYTWRYPWGYYKSLLGQGDLATEELYDPLFFSTDVDAMARLHDDDIAILELTVDADWLCAKPRDAQDMGYEPATYADAQWAESCEHHLDMVVRYDDRLYQGSKPRHWDAPDPADTIAYLGSHMAEFRVYNPALIKNVRVYEDLDDVLNGARDAWDSKGKIVDEPFVWPYFKPRTRWVR